MTNWEEDRQKKIAEIVTSTYIICFLLVLMPVVQTFSLRAGTSSASLFVLGLSFCALLGLGVAYIRKITAARTDFGTSVRVFDSVLVVLSVAVVSFLIQRSGAVYLQILYVVPVLVAGVGFPRRTALFLIGFVALVMAVNNCFLAGVSVTRIALTDLVVGTGMLLVGWLVTELVDMEKEGRARILGLTDRDVLTGLYNHRYYQEYLRSRIQVAERQGKLLSLVLFDVDLFKFYNEMHGYRRGDEVLQRVGRILGEKVKQPAIAARVGGDEFAFILPNTRADKAVALAGAVSREIGEALQEGLEIMPGTRLRISTGVAAYPEHGKGADDIHRAADYALYKAKNNETGKVELYFNVFESLRSELTREDERPFGHAKVLIGMVDAKDQYTFGHSERVLEYAVRLADFMGLAPNDREALFFASYLHDVGKSDVSKELLNKATTLTESEWATFKSHPVWGKQIVEPFMPDVRVGLAVLHHHENYDGTGYPGGMVGETIPFLARMLRVIDSFDAMTTDRPYKKRKSRKAALAEILDAAGTLYDPVIAARFAAMIRAEGNLSGP